MTTRTITRLLPGGAPGGRMAPLGYIDPAMVSEGSAIETGHIFFTNEAATVNVGVWECTPCTEEVSDYPYDQCCFVLEGSLTITDEAGHAETFGPGDAFVIPRGFNGSWRMTERYRNYFITVEPQRKD